MTDAKILDLAVHAFEQSAAAVLRTAELLPPEHRSKIWAASAKGLMAACAADAIAYLEDREGKRYTKQEANSLAGTLLMGIAVQALASFERDHDNVIAEETIR